MAEPVRFGRYSLIKRIASGGMAEIYLAKQQGPGTFERSLVIKRMLPHLSEDPKFVQMFLDEAALAAQLNHPHIAQVLDFGQEEDSYFIALELIKGPDLRLLNQAVKKIKGQIPTEVAMKMVAQTCQALDYAHRALDQKGRPLNIVHRDVSPQNVLVSYDGVVKLVDFGIAKASSSGQNTEAGVVKGKFAYLSPEQVRAQKLDGRSDLYAAGLVLFELLTGEQGLQGDGPAAIANAMDANVTPIANYRDDLPAELLMVLEQALQKDRNDRQSSCLEFANQLDDLLAQWGMAVGQPEIAAYVRQLEVDVGEPLSAAARTGSFVAGAEMPPPGTGPGGRNRNRSGGTLDTDGGEDGQEPTAMPARRTGTRGEIAPPPGRTRSSGGRPAVQVPEPVSRRTTGQRRAVEVPDEPVSAPRRTGMSRPSTSESGDVTLPPKSRSGSRPAVRAPPRQEEPEEADSTGDEGAEDSDSTVDPEADEPTPPPRAPPTARARPRASQADEVTPVPAKSSRGRPAARARDEEDEEEEAPPRRKEKKSGVGGFLSFLIFVALLGGGGYGAWYKTLGPGKPPEPEPPPKEIPHPPVPPKALLPAGAAASAPTGPTGATGPTAAAAPTGATAASAPTGAPPGTGGGEAKAPPAGAEEKKKPHTRVASKEPGEAKEAKEVRSDGPPDGQAGLVVEAEPTSEVFVDDKSVGNTPLKTGVAPGAHSVKVRSAKLKLERALSLNLVAGEWSKQNVVFQKGTVRIKAIPWANVTFGGKDLGQTPIKKAQEVYEGTYEVVFTNGGKTQTKSVTVKGGDDQEVSADFSQ